MEKKEISLRDKLYLFRKSVFNFPYRNKVNLKHINLAGFRTLCSIAIFPHRENIFESTQTTITKNDERALELLSNIGKHDWLFVNTTIADRITPALEDALKNFEGVVILDPADRELHEKPAWIPIRATWCAPHIPNPHTNLGICLPVGVEERSANVNGRENLLTFSSRKMNKLLIGPFGQTHTSRADYNFFNSSDDVHVFNKRMKPRDYADLASRYRFVFCPRGNGIDTHRFWESLYRGSIPVVFESPWSNYFKEKGFPLIEIHSNEDLYLVPSRYKDNYRSSEEIFELSKTILSLTYWKQLIIEKQKSQSHRFPPEVL